VTERVFIVGDIHACPQELERLLGALPLQSRDRLIFLGDYIDRGPGAREVVDLLLALKADGGCRPTFLKGNHEDMLLDFLGYPGNYGEAFLLNGGNSTLTSYGLSTTVSGPACASGLPPTHLQFFLDLETLSVQEDLLCVHAGVNPQRSLEEQGEEELLWIRQEFIFQPHSLPYTVVFGHTPQRAVFFDLPYKVGIDTGLVYGGKLSCLEWAEKKLYQVARGSQKVLTTDVSNRWVAAGLLARSF
jgi:serine/threonine protein phosphatase 1